jgi:hypothetical protein
VQNGGNKNRPDRSLGEAGGRDEGLLDAEDRLGVLSFVKAQHLLHLIFRMQLEFFQPLLFDFLIFREKGLRFQVSDQSFVNAMLVYQIAKLRTGLYQMCFEVFLCALFHVEACLLEWSCPPTTGQNAHTRQPVGSFTSRVLKWRLVVSSRLE